MMKFDHLPGTEGVVRFPVERRAAATLLLAQELAPRADLVGAMADERTGDEGRPDTMAVAAEAFTGLAEALEVSMGEAAVVGLRALVEVQVQQACALGWQYRDAETDAEDAAAALKAARTSGAVAMVDGLDERVRRTRAVWAERALAARAATDAALGMQGALDFHEHGEPWRRPTGAENGRWLVEHAPSRQPLREEPV